jgi:hypothetical protein
MSDVSTTGGGPHDGLSAATDRSYRRQSVRQFPSQFLSPASRLVQPGGNTIPANTRLQSSPRRREQGQGTKPRGDHPLIGARPRAIIACGQAHRLGLGQGLLLLVVVVVVLWWSTRLDATEHRNFRCLPKRTAVVDWADKAKRQAEAEFGSGVQSPSVPFCLVCK